MKEFQIIEKLCKNYGIDIEIVDENDQLESEPYILYISDDWIEALSNGDDFFTVVREVCNIVTNEMVDDEYAAVLMTIGICADNAKLISEDRKEELIEEFEDQYLPLESISENRTLGEFIEQFGLPIDVYMPFFFGDFYFQARSVDEKNRKVEGMFFKDGEEYRSKTYSISTECKLLRVIDESEKVQKFVDLLVKSLPEKTQFQEEGEEDDDVDHGNEMKNDLSDHDYERLHNVSTIPKEDDNTLELNIMKLDGDSKSYDLRLWSNGEPLNGVLLKRRDIEKIIVDYKENGEIIEEIDFRDFFIHTDEHFCFHETESIKAVLPICNRNGLGQVTIAAEFCPDCGIYYVRESEYLKAKGQGTILCKLMSKEEYLTYKRSLRFGELNAESILHMVGYNVDSQKNLSQEERRNILRFAISEEIVTRSDAISHIRYLIRLHEKNQRYRLAIKKWKDDLDWLRGYEGGGERMVGVRRIIENTNDD